jgi:hypothetical protein
MADDLILFTILFVVLVGLAGFVIWWQYSFREGGKSRPKRGRRRRDRPNADNKAALPVRGTGRTLAELETKK